MSYKHVLVSPSPSASVSQSEGEATVTDLAGAGVEDDGGVQGDCNAESVLDSNRRAAAPAKVLVNGTKKAAQRAMATVKDRGIYLPPPTWPRSSGGLLRA